MLAEYPYGSIKNTGALHSLIGMGLIAANAHAYLSIKNQLSILDIFKLFPVNITSTLYFFIPVFAVGVYIVIMGCIGGAAGSRSYNKAVVNNFKIFYMIVNALSTFLISWFGAIDIFVIFLMNGLNADVFDIHPNIYASFGLMLAELLLAIFSIILCCLSGYPDGTPKNASIPLAVISQPSVQPAASNQGHMYDPKVTTSFVNNPWSQLHP